ncbi:TRAP transporter small permease [Pontitalea aquivivens]|uniref:TRAP transporter small permease n=1 Tax=Pontitalea aquivivens TaxID=3388663 RepID=UPI0039710AA9
MTGKARSAAISALLYASAGCFILGAGVTVVDVALRGLAGRNVPAAIELTSFAIGLGALLAMPVCYGLRSNVTARLLSELMPNRFGRPLSRLGAASAVVFAAVLFWVMAGNALAKIGSPETSRDLGLPMPVLLGLVAVCLGLSLLAAVAGLWSEWRKARPHD